MSRRFEIIFLITGIAVQIITYVLAPTTILSLISGLFGITSVILCSQGNIWTFFFGFGQIITYSVLCYSERFYAGIAMNAFYFLSQIYGIYTWRQLQSSSNATRIVPNTLSRPLLVLIALTALAVSAIVGFMLQRFTDDTQPYMDALTTVISIVAQVLLVMAYTEQWIFWLVVDIMYVALWISAGNWSMVAQYTFWCINCLYGLYYWKRLNP